MESVSFSAVAAAAAAVKSALIATARQLACAILKSKRAKAATFRCAISARTAPVEPLIIANRIARLDGTRRAKTKTLRAG